MPDDLEKLWGAAMEPAEMGLKHVWSQGYPRDVDKMTCDRCGLTVSYTQFASVRDSECGEWPVIGDQGAVGQ